MKYFLRLLFCTLLIISFGQVIHAQDSCWQDGDMITYTQEDWGGDPSDGAAKLLYDNFSSLYPSGLVVGYTPITILFDNVNDLLNYLPASGAAGVLANSVTNPSSTPAGEFGGAVISLKLDIDFSDSGFIEGTSGIRFGDLMLTGFDDPGIDGYTVRQFLGELNFSLGGGYTNLGYTFADYNSIALNLAASFNNGKVSKWAQIHLIKDGEFHTGDMITYGQDSWAAGNPATILTNYYDNIYGSAYGTVTVGINAPGYFYMLFSGSSSILKYLPAGGAAGPLTSNLVDPTASSSGQFGGDALALRLDIDYSDAGYIQGNDQIPFGDIILCNFTTLSKLNGLTVRQFAGIVDTLLAGGSSIYSIPQINALTSIISRSFDGGHVAAFANAHLRIGQCVLCATNQCPTASNLSLVTTEDVAIKFKLKGYDPDNDPLTFSISQSPANGNVSLSSDGSATYTPSAGYLGADQFKYKVSDGICETVATVNLSVLKAKAFTGSITLTGQTDVNSFGGNNYTSISGDLNVRGAASVSDLSPLFTITSVGGWIIIDLNDSLSNLNGLNNIANLGGLLQVSNNRSLRNIDALDKITTVGGISITSDSALTNINGLTNITTVKGGNLAIQYNPHLTSIDPLSNITVVGGGLHVVNNDMLTNIDGLKNIDSVGGLNVQNNKSLTSIDGLSSLTSVRGNLYVQNNAALSDFCSLYTLINGNGLGGFYYVNGNAVNPTKEEIKANGPCVTTSALDNKTNSIPTEYKLEQNYPNPFNPSTTISFDLPKQSYVTLKVYNVLGEEIKTLVNETRNAGHYQEIFDAKLLPSGVYLYKIQANGYTLTKKMMLVK